MRHPIILLVAFVLVIASGCGPTENEFRDSFRWISGKWTTTESEIQKVENWMWNKHRFEGIGYHLKDGDTVFREFLFLEQYETQIGYSAVFGDNGPFTFPLSHSDGQVFVFQNEDHDFPSQVIYRLDSDSSITITLIGNGNPSKEEQSYQLVRTK